MMNLKMIHLEENSKLSKTYDKEKNKLVQEKSELAELVKNMNIVNDQIINSSSSIRKKVEEMVKGPNGGILEKATNIILDAVRKGDVVQQDAKQFAGGLDPEVMGRFIHKSNERNFQFDDRAMQEILTNFYKVKAFSLEPRETIDAIVRALQEAGLPYLAHEIEQDCQND